MILFHFEEASGWTLKKLKFLNIVVHIVQTTVHLYLIHLHCSSTTVIFFKTVFGRNVSIVSFALSPLTVECHRASTELQERLVCRSEVFLASSLPPDGASGALVTNGHVFCPLKTSLPFASHMKSNRQNEPGKVWSSPCCSWVLSSYPCHTHLCVAGRIVSWYVFGFWAGFFEWRQNNVVLMLLRIRVLGTFYVRIAWLRVPGVSVLTAFPEG